MLGIRGRVGGQAGGLPTHRRGCHRGGQTEGPATSRRDGPHIWHQQGWRQVERVAGAQGGQPAQIRRGQGVQEASLGLLHARRHAQHTCTHSLSSPPRSQMYTDISPWNTHTPLSNARMDAHTHQLPLTLSHKPRLRVYTHPALQFHTHAHVCRPPLHPLSHPGTPVSLHLPCSAPATGPQGSGCWMPGWTGRSSAR